MVCVEFRISRYGAMRGKDGSGASGVVLERLASVARDGVVAVADALRDDGRG